MLDAALDAFEGAVRRLQPGLRLRETGTVLEVGHGVARIGGLPGLQSEELVVFEGGQVGIAFNLEEHEAGIVLLEPAEDLRAGTRVRPTGRLADTPVGEALLGRVLDATGRSLDDLGPIRTPHRWPVERDAPAIIDRAPVTVPLQTGVKVVDALVPVGRGQRELIIGDRQTGKTALAVDALLNQRGRDVIGIYCAIGQRGTAVARVVADLQRHGVMSQCIVVVAGGDDPPGLQWLTPYAATSMGEYFMAQGRDVLIVYDDLTRHARAYRELSLLLRRPPGREAYPGDIFYLHARLLERATHLRPTRGGGSLTALPIIETQGQNLAAYIPTNLISICDGQILLSPDLVGKALLPAVDVGKSVSRVGGKTQLPALRAVAGELRLRYAQFEELETFSRFATRLDDATRAAIERGRRMRELLRQDEHAPLAVAEQVAVLLALNAGLFDGVALEAVRAAEQRVCRRVRDDLPDLCHRLEQGGALGPTERERLLATARAAIADDGAAHAHG